VNSVHLLVLPHIGVLSGFPMSNACLVDMNLLVKMLWIMCMMLILQTLKHLQFDEAKLRQVGVHGESPVYVSFLVNQVSTTCLFRETAFRVMSAKPSTAVERLWNGFGDHLTAKRRSFQNNTLASVVYAKMNHKILGTHGDVITKAQFDSLLEFVGEAVEEELVQHSKGGVQKKQTKLCDHLMSEPYRRRLVVLGVQRVGEWSNMIVVV
jgi:hypothetical protein